MVASGCFTAESRNRIVDIDVSVSSYVVKRYQMNSQVRHYIGDTVVPHYRYYSLRISMLLRDRIVPIIYYSPPRWSKMMVMIMLTTAVMMVAATITIERW